MGMYFRLQWKRVSRYLIGALCVVLVLMGGLLVAYRAMTSAAAGSEENQKIQVAICGDVDDPIMQMGLQAVMALDSSQYSLDVQILEEEEAADALEAGEIAAYVVVPEGFMNGAFCGELIPMTMVTTPGSASIVSIFKDEVTAMIAGMVVDAQKGVFGLIDLLGEYEIPDEQIFIDTLAFEYVDFILSRNEVYTLEELGIADDLRFSTYLLCGLAVLLVMLACLPFAPLMIRQDDALGRMLAAKGKPLWKQCLCQFGAWVLGMIALLIVLLLAAAVCLALLKPDALKELPILSIFINGVPVIVMAAALSYFLFSLSQDLISGVLLHFFLVVAMCFVSGCMYPVYFFPQSIQRLAGFLPTGVARSQLAGVFTGEFPWNSFGLLMAFSTVFLALGTGIRVAGTKNGGR